jgi:PEP-CTERM motif
MAMKFQRLILAGAFAAAGLTGMSSAQAETWVFSYTGPGVTASGTFVTAGAALVAEDVLSISGLRNGVAITGLVPVGSDSDFIYDNQFTITSPNFTDGGILFSTAENVNTNVYFFEGEYFEVQAGTPEVSVAWRVSAVPEPATVLSMLAGLGLLGAFIRKSRAAQ